MPRTIPKKRKCRSCWRNFDPRDLVTEPGTHDERGYPVPSARWCPTCAAARLAELRASDHPSGLDAEAADILQSAIDRFNAAKQQEFGRP